MNSNITYSVFSSNVTHVKRGIVRRMEIMYMIRKLSICLIIFLFTLTNYSQAQGITRASGLGFRVSAWSKKINDFKFVEVNGDEVLATGGGWIYYFSRFNPNWFWEINIGGIGDVHVKSEMNEEVDVNSITPILFGMRYDWLTTRVPGKLQPYITFGGGPYWLSSVRAIDNDEVTKTNMEIGVYTGTGMNFVLSSRFALNLDLKYHFIGFSPTHEASGFDFGIGFSLMWGKKKEIFRIRDTRLIVKDIYPAYYQFYNTYPLALVSVENTAGYPIEVNVKCKVTPYSTRTKDSGFIKINKNETQDIQATAVFDPDITKVSTRKPAVLDIEVEGRAGTTHTKEISRQLTIHTINSWNGEVDKLEFFITPDDENIIQMSRNIVNSLAKPEIPQTNKFLYAKSVFNELCNIGIQYQSDPNIPYYKDDRVQFANETLNLRRGDCDDLVVLYSSLLESLGINTAFVQVQDPEESLAHLYLLFDTGVTTEYAHYICQNEKRYLVRENIQSEQNSIWIPVETTLVAKGFDEAWNSGALNYLKEVKLRNGLDEGWVQIIDVQ
jgi:hypothetical protein